jgi:hypothetical protein
MQTIASLTYGGMPAVLNKDTAQVKDFPDGLEIAKRTISPIPSQFVNPKNSVDVICVNCGDLSFTVLPQRGMQVNELTYQGVSAGWDTPIGQPYHPKDINPKRPGRVLLNGQTVEGIGGFLDGFASIVTPCFPRFGGPLKEMGEGFDTLHGTATYASADYRTVVINVNRDEKRHYVQLSGKTDVGNFQIMTYIIAALGGNSIIYAQQIHNLGGKPLHFEYAFHNQLRIGDVVLPTTRVEPKESYGREQIENWWRYGEPTTKMGEQLFFHTIVPVQGLEAHTLLQNGIVRRDLTASLVVDPKDKEWGVYNAWFKLAMPMFVQWKNNGPWFVDESKLVRVFGSESSHCNVAGQDTFAELLPGGSVIFEQEIGVVLGRKRVQALETLVREAVPGGPELIMK